MAAAMDVKELSSGWQFKQTDEEVGDTRPFVSNVMTRVSSAERRVALRRSVPFGLSILLVGRRSN